MAKSDIVAGLDIGSAQVVCVIGRRDPQTGQIEILSGSRTACLGGLKGGVVININETARAITRICEEAEDAAKEMVKDVTIAVRGNHLQTFNNHGALNIARTDKEITADDVEKAIENAQAVHLSQDREIIHTIPQGFTLDRQQGVPNPVGMEGSLLEVDVHIVTASRSHLSNIFKAINMAGFSVSEPIYGLFAAGEVVVTQEERDLGSILIDIGGQTTDIAVYFDGSVHFTEKLTIGADAITRDLAYGLRTSLSQAQQIKENYGVAMATLLEQNEGEVNFTAMDGRTFRKVNRRQLIEMIEPRVEEIFHAHLREASGFRVTRTASVPGGRGAHRRRLSCLKASGAGGGKKSSALQPRRDCTAGRRRQQRNRRASPALLPRSGFWRFRTAGDGQWAGGPRLRAGGRAPVPAAHVVQRMKEWVEETF